MPPFINAILAAFVVGSGIWLVDKADSRAAWLLAFLILLVIALHYPSVGTEFASLLGLPTGNQITSTNPSGVANAEIPNSSSGLTASQNGTVAASF